MLVAIRTEEVRDLGLFYLGRVSLFAEGILKGRGALFGKGYFISGAALHLGEVFYSEGGEEQRSENFVQKIARCSKRLPRFRNDRFGIQTVAAWTKVVLYPDLHLKS